jgi:hypothetical protein
MNSQPLGREIGICTSFSYFLPHAEVEILGYQGFTSQFSRHCEHSTLNLVLAIHHLLMHSCSLGFERLFNYVYGMFWLGKYKIFRVVETGW